ncbi:MAG: LamG-like jellyroll fold domain-containing protein [Candidatus Paceibacterota bacterium]
MKEILKKSFTLIELLVVIAIIGILSGLIVVTMNGVTAKANIAKSQVFSNSLRNALMLNLVSEWKFDGTTADGSPATTSDVLDTWSNINNGSVPYPPTVRTGSNCVSGSCLQFDGSNDYVGFGSDSSLSMRTGDATVSFWVKFDNALAPQAETLVMTGAGDAGTGKDGYWIFRPASGNQIRGSFTDGSAEQIYGYLSGFLSANTWHNIAIVFDRDVSAYAYINGEKQTGYSIAITPQQGDVQNYTFTRIGAWSYNFDRFTGKMDEVRLFNAAVPASQIKEQYYSGLNSLLGTGQIDENEYFQKIFLLASK